MSSIIIIIMSVLLSVATVYGIYNFTQKRSNKYVANQLSFDADHLPNLNKDDDLTTAA